MPPTRSTGSSAIPVTTKPTPPIACRRARHSRTERGWSSRPLITVAPVVVMPDIDSKSASTGVSPPSHSGSPPASPAVSQTEAVSRKVCIR